MCEIMKIVLSIFMLYFFVDEGYSQKVLPNLLGTDFHECVKCVCHARSGCFSRINCARYSISRSYWERAGSPSGNYGTCMRNENCILNTIKGYTDSFGDLDCNCDEVYNCVDILAVHLAGGRCSQSLSKERTRRYNNCAKTYDLPRYIEGNCEGPDAQ